MKTSLPVPLPSSVNQAPALGRLPSILRSAKILTQLVHGWLSFSRLGAPNLSEEPPGQLHYRARRLQNLSRILLQHLRMEVRVAGPLPPPHRAGLQVANHVSFADILVLSSLHPTVFVAKSDVAAWPLIGPIAAAAGTIFVQRERRTDVARANAALQSAIQAGLRVTLFPEGTSSDGRSVLPFMPSLLQPALRIGADITPTFLQYLNPDGSRVDEIAYFGDRHLQDCLWALISRKSTVAQVHFGPTRPPHGDRKSLAQALHEEVSALAHFPRPSLLNP